MHLAIPPESAKPLEAPRSSQRVPVVHAKHGPAIAREDSVAVEEPLAIALEFGETAERQTKTVAITMRTPGDDTELAVGFLMTEGVLKDAADVNEVVLTRTVERVEETESEAVQRNTALVRLAPGSVVTLSSLERNFYTTSSCGVCGKASLLALRTVCPPRSANGFSVSQDVLTALPERLRAQQAVFERTGGLHGCGLFDAEGRLLASREDVGRHNALDKLLGAEFLADRVPLRERILLLSGRASFELLQKSVMAGIQLVAAVGAPSSLAVAVAREFDVTLVGFLRNETFNVYHGAQRIPGCAMENNEA